MVITCQSCGTRFQIRDELLAGGPKRTKCKKCGEILVIKPPESNDTPGGAAKATSGAAAKETVKAAAESADVKSRKTAPTAPAAAEKPAESAGKPAPAEQPAAAADTAATEEDAEDIQAKLEKRRLQMEDEISGRLNKAALETLDFEVLGELAQKIKSIEDNPEFQPEPSTQLFACIKCLAIYSLFTEDPRQCANCPGDVALVKGDDILKQFGMFNR
ncbi:MAG: hypothetical protein A3F83_01315 [Candidatus Glassbacteria bacterium RIFCSPLOWO2_12_FULL_58_11]|uniref:Zinc finger/thioredoxin putative domain-containing protein n=1 Tax=Candidatus Glassbacteria bacterium RIFCSPLOWO2_12_FULL_58_11 TaxID=1817867 RepID=A0A1F5YL08_9BACT|nr:MAG: hypothetical protein A3F83_01315 [Candidatus Glassbacteria bacterium RIFCSPLOWO2_12_FULL_58_11]